MTRSMQPQRILAVLIALVSAGLLGHTRVALAQPTTSPRLQKTDLLYQGAFRLPAGTFRSSSFHYGGTALTYNPSNNSLFIVGHDWEQKVAEVEIPQIVNSAQLSSLATTRVLQSFTDASEGKMFTVDDGTIKVGGLLVHGRNLYGAVYSYYDADITQVHSHYRSALNLAVQGDVQGMYQVGSSNPGAGFVSGYMTTIPSEWQSLLGGPALTGQCCIPITGRTSSGPAAFVFNPNDLGVKNPVPALALVYYPLSNPLSAWDSTSPLFNGSTEIKGVIFPQGTRSLLFFGRHGIGTFCYGGGDECNDPEDHSKGTHAYPYVYQVWAYDAEELLQVKNGQVQPWNVRPYTTWTLTLPIPSVNTRIGGAGYDPQTRRIFLSQQCADGDCLPVIHVFTVKNAAATDAVQPSPPTNLRTP
jgi:hypothetical protein